MSDLLARPGGLPARLALLALLLLGVLATPTAAQAATVVREELNLRSGPGLGYRVLTVMPSGAAVTLAGNPAEGWYPLVYNGFAGWAYGVYLAIDGGGGGARSAATVITAWLNLRGGPGLGQSIIAGLPYGTTVEVLGNPQAADGYSWFQVRVAGVGSGWVAGQYLDLGAPLATTQAPAPSPAPPTPPPPAAATPAPPAPARASSGNAIVDIITDAANRYGQSPTAMLAIARCESGLDPNAYNRSSGASGLFQFLPGTWRTTPYASSSIFDPWANANAAAWMWSVGRRGEWSC